MPPCDHAPVFKLTRTSASTLITSYITTCSKCGDAVEVRFDERQRPTLRLVK